MVAALCGGLIAIIAAGTLSGLIALTGLRLGAPLIDAKLAYADSLLGIDTPRIVAWTARHPTTADVLNVAYALTVPAVFAAVVILAAKRRTDRMWQLCQSFASCGAICAILSAFVPAIGAFAYYGHPPQMIESLPGEAGLFHLTVFELYRSGKQSVIDLSHLEGVVTFPSFHACMALMVPYALRGKGWLSAAAWGAGVLVIVSTVPIGGHYGVDIIAGALIWSAVVLLDAVWRRFWRTRLSPPRSTAGCGSSGGHCPARSA